MTKDISCHVVGSLEGIKPQSDMISLFKKLYIKGTV